MVASQYPDATIEVWAQDEARFGLLPSTRRVWSTRGDRPNACSRRRYEWGYLYGFVHPESGRTEWVIGSSVCTEAMSAVLAEFAVEVGAGPHKRIILVWDGAGWHTAKELVVPEGIHIVQLPPYSPELQPAECVWPLVNEVIANQDFRDLDHLVNVVGDRCLELSRQPREVRSHSLFWWWPRVAV